MYFYTIIIIEVLFTAARNNKNMCATTEPTPWHQIDVKNFQAHFWDVPAEILSIEAKTGSCKHETKI